MISETMPLNEWPLLKLESLLTDLQFVQKKYKDMGQEFTSTNTFITIVEKAIKDAEFEDEKAFDRYTEGLYGGDGNFASNH